MAKRRTRTNDFVDWIERTIHLPLGLSAEPGQITLPVYLREIAAAMDDPAVEKITIQKSARIGFSTLLSSLIAYRFTEQPAPILLVLPAELDARNAVVALEDIFDCSPDLKGRLPNPSLGRSDRNTILARKGLNGAHLRCVGAHAPRNLRAIAAQVVLMDEADALQDTEGDVIALAEARSLTFKRRLTIVGGTPLLADTSRVARSFAESDQQIYECRCALCRSFAELRWPQFEWEPGRPDTKAAATRLANAGCSVDQVKAITGHRSLAEVARYTKAADQRRLARQALDLQLWTEGEQKLSSLSSRLDKTGSN